MGRYDDAGFTPESRTEWEAKTTQEFLDELGEDYALEDETVIQQLISLSALGRTVQDEHTVRQIQGLSLFNATKGQLDDLGTLLRILRRRPAHSTVTARLSGVDGTTVRSGSRARTTGGHLFATTEDAVLTEAGVDVPMASVDLGPIPAPAGSLNAIVTGVTGWETVRNERSAILGRISESDIHYRLSQTRKSAQGAVAHMNALKAGCYAAGADKLWAESNDDDDPQDYQGWTIGPHGLMVIATGSTDAALDAAVQTYRGMGVPVYVAIRGRELEVAALSQIQARARAATTETLTWNGRVTGHIAFAADTDWEGVENAINHELVRLGVRVHHQFDPGYFVAIYKWKPGETPTFSDNATSRLLGLTPLAAVSPPGAFMRPETHPLTVTADVTRTGAFPADGLNLLRTALINQIDSYDVGDPVRHNDLLIAMESVPGTRVTNLMVAGDESNPPGVVWSLSNANIRITVS